MKMPLKKSTKKKLTYNIVFFPFTKQQHFPFNNEVIIKHIISKMILKRGVVDKKKIILFYDSIKSMIKVVLFPVT